MCLKNELKNTFTSYWEYLALRAACQLNIFDVIKKGATTLKDVVEETKSDKKSLEKLLDYLVEINSLTKKDCNYGLTLKGELLTEIHPESLKQACILWGGEHMSAWQNLAYTIKTGLPSFKKEYNDEFFNFIKRFDDKLYNYQNAISEYARDDYKSILNYFDFSNFNMIADIGGGTGVLISIIAKKYFESQCVLIDIPEVIKMVKSPLNNLKLVGTDFFKSFNFKADIFILSRVLHDWNDEKAFDILLNCANSLNKGGKLLIIEIMQDVVKANALTLNMLLMTESYERTNDQYNSLVLKAGLKISSKIKLNELQTILIAEKDGL